MSKKITIDEIFNDDDFGLLKPVEPKASSVRTPDDRLVDSFEEINAFVDKNNREPNASSMSEYNLLARLKAFGQDEVKKKLLKPFDRHNLLGHVEMDEISIDDLLNEDDEFGLLDTDQDLSIFRYKYITKQEDRAETDFIAQRKPMNEEEFEPYEKMFQKVHKEIKEGKRKIKPFQNIEQNLHIGDFYILDGVFLYLESAKIEQTKRALKSGDRIRKDGRTKTIFENGTYSDMLYRSLGKQIQKNGKLVTNADEAIENELFVNANFVKESDIQTGWVYVLKSKSTNPKIANIENLHKIGFSSVPIEERIKNARNEATYLFADVQKVTSYRCYNRNADKLEQLLHRFFAEACLNIDIFNDKSQRITPREWFIVPLDIIEEAIQLILHETIVNYRYDVTKQKIVTK